MSKERVAIVGRGRFGRALASLVERARLPLTTHDLGDAPVPSDATLVVLAVPLDAIAGAAAALGGAPLVLDVASVKVEAARALAGALVRDGGPSWCATHPLFGPNSVDDPARQLKVVVCPNEEQPAATRRARAFYERLGCVVREMSPTAHDELMADTQAIAFLLGEALRAAGLGAQEPWGPPSAEALHRLAFGVTQESGHVRDAILARNPFAAAARARLLGALEQGREALDVAPANDIVALRARIDGLDARIIDLLAQRATVATEISRAKAAEGLPVQDPAREAQALAARRARAETAGIDPDFIGELFDDVMRWSRAVQNKDRAR